MILPFFGKSTIHTVSKQAVAHQTCSIFFKFENPDEESLTELLNIVTMIIVGDKNDDAYNYYLDWLAFILQKPWMKTDIVLLLYSNEHVIGKSTLQTLACNLVGEE